MPGSDVQELPRELVVLRFRAYVLSLVSLLMLAIASMTSWGYVRVVRVFDSALYDLWNLKFYTVLRNGIGNPQPAFKIYFVLALIMVIAILLINIILVLGLMPRPKLKLSYGAMGGLAISAVVVSALLMYYVSNPLLVKMGFPSIFGSISGYTPAGSEAVIYSDPGIAWYLILFTLVLNVLLFVILGILRGVTVEEEDESEEGDGKDDGKDDGDDDGKDDGDDGDAGEEAGDK